ncbi:MAG: TIGR01777 family oxidoreductase [Acidobacteriota bacterium]|nr:TIGR01777 family oxidoreductase [Acidobacteriota bacterium]
MRVLISGASGLIGQALRPVLIAAGHEPVALVRRAAQANEVEWDPSRPLDPAKLAGCDAIVHLAGKNIAGYWTKKFKQEARDSRVRGTQTLAEAAAESFRRTGQPGVFLSASAIGYYGNRGDEVLTEESAAGAGYLADVSQEWEAAAAAAREAGLRVVNLRIGVVLAGNGGALKPMLLPFKLGLGGRIGSGKQYWSWIALDDVVGAILFALQDDRLKGPVNLTAPEPASNEQFVRALGEGLHRPTIFPLPAWVVSTLMGEMGDAALLGSARVMPAKLQAAGYTFRYPTLETALRAALHSKN